MQVTEQFLIRPQIFNFASPDRFSLCFSLPGTGNPGSLAFLRQLYRSLRKSLPEQGVMRFRHASINDLPIHESERRFFWPLGRRPDDHPGLSEPGL